MLVLLERQWPVPGFAATLPVVCQRSIQRIVVEAARSRRRATSRRLSPPSTKATARALKSVE
jgi:hypothetical protein